jgi:hypothetical protein
VFSCKAVIVGILVQCCAASLSGAASAAVLISEEEAKLPPPKGAVAIDRRGVSRAPKVILMSNTDAFADAPSAQIRVVRRNQDR